VKSTSFVRLLFLGIIIMCFLPWAMVSCTGQKVASATGYQLATGRYTDSENGKTSKQLGAAVGRKLAGTTQTVLMGIMILSGFGILAGALGGEESLGAMACISAVQSVALVGSYFKAPVLFTKALVQQAPELVFSFEPAFYWTLLLSVACTILCLVLLGTNQEDPSDGKKGPPPVTVRGTEDANRDGLEQRGSDSR
jgi:hypothetical protein